MDDTLKRKLELICDVIRQTAPVESIYLFGSYAYGTPNKDSDLDLYVVIPDDGPRPLKVMQEIRFALFLKQDMPLDILVSRSAQFAQRSACEALEQDVFEKGVLLYGREQGQKQRMA